MRRFSLLDFYFIFAAAFARRDTLRLARFFGMVLPADFMIFDSALRVAVAASALSPDATALVAFLISVRTAFLRAIFTTRFFSDTRMRFFDDL